MASHIACVFPTFPMRQSDFTPDAVHGFTDVIAPIAARAARIVPIGPHTFDRPNPADPGVSVESTMNAHYACYIENLAMAALWERRFPACDYIAAYSMGLFPALCHSGALAFDDGLRLMHAIAAATPGVIAAGPYAMGIIVGLTAEEVGGRLRASGADLEITDIYAPRTIIVSGRHESVAHLVDRCASVEGVIEAYPIPVGAPFHSSALRGIAPIIRHLLTDVPVGRPRCGVLSPITQQVLSHPDDIRQELTDNVWHPMAWHATVRALVDAGVDVMLECGTSIRLTEHARRDVPGDFVIHDYRDLGA